MQLLSLIRSHAWLAIAALVIAAALAAAKSPKLGSLFARVPREQRPRVVLVLGILSGILDAITRGTPWTEALAYGGLSAALAALGHGVAGGLTPGAEKPAPPVNAAPPGVVDLPAPSVAPPDLTPRTDVRWPQAELDFDDKGKP